MDTLRIPRTLANVTVVLSAGPTGPSIKALLKPEFVPQATFFCFVASFIVVFRALVSDWIQASHLNSFNLLGLITLGVTSRANRHNQVSKIANKNAGNTDMKLSWLLPPFVLYICSPLLLSLTKATTSDSIWPLSGALFTLASILGGFGENVGMGRRDNRAELARSSRARQTYKRRSSFGELTLVDKSQR